MLQAEFSFDVSASSAGSPAPRPSRRQSVPIPTVSEPAIFPTAPVVKSFQDAIVYIDHRSDWPEAVRTGRKTALRQIAWSIALIQTRKSGQHLDLDRKKLDLAALPFDTPFINQALEGVSYGLAGFTAEKSYRNARSGLRLVGRALGKIAPMKAVRLPPNSPYAPLLACTTRWNESAARLFAARLNQQGRHPSTVTSADLLEHGAYLRANFIAKKAEAALKRIVLLWQKTATQEPNWPQTPLTLPTPSRVISPPFSLYPVSLQQEVETVRTWMQGAALKGPFDNYIARKPFRFDTIQHRLKTIRLMLGVLVQLGVDPQAITSLSLLLKPATMQAILQALWERGQQRRAALPEQDRPQDPAGATGQTHTAGLTLLMLTHCFPQPPAVLKELQWLAKRVRLPKQSEISRKNRTRLAQFDDPVMLARLRQLPYKMMDEALKKRGEALQENEPAELAAAARLARIAILFAIEARIPLRIKNLQSCRLGHNLRFADAQSQVVTLGFQSYETKNWMEIEFFVGPRLCQLLKLYIDYFLPVFAARSPDYADKQWLFPADEGRPGPLSINQVRKIIIDTAAERVGAVFHPHLFRALAVMLCLKHAPNALEQCRQLLGDKTLQIILMHYAPVRRKEAAAFLDKLVSAEEDRLSLLTKSIGRPSTRSGDRS